MIFGGRPPNINGLQPHAKSLHLQAPSSAQLLQSSSLQAPLSYNHQMTLCLSPLIAWEPLVVWVGNAQ